MITTNHMICNCLVADWNWLQSIRFPFVKARAKTLNWDDWTILIIMAIKKITWIYKISIRLNNRISHIHRNQKKKILMMHRGHSFVRYSQNIAPASLFFIFVYSELEKQIKCDRIHEPKPFNENRFIPLEFQDE